MPVEAVVPRPEEIERHLAKLLEAPLFARAGRQSRLLRFLVEKAIEETELTESQIGVQVYFRPEDYSTQDDPVVRVEAARLRSRLREYYAADGAKEPLRIDLPTGSLMPVFELADGWRRSGAAESKATGLDFVLPDSPQAAARTEQSKGLWIVIGIMLAIIAAWWLFGR
jgi:hypothetical protein